MGRREYRLAQDCCGSCTGDICTVYGNNGEPGVHVQRLVKVVLGHVYTRGKLIEERHGGRPCPGPSTEREECNNDPCPVDCRWGAWREWSKCTRTCGGGRRTRTREMIKEMHGGRPCIGSSTQTEDCNKDPCPVDCEFVWGEYSKCSKTCGGGTKTRHPIISQRSMYGGQPCPSPQTMRCNDFNCPSCLPGYNKCKGQCIKDQDKDCVSDEQDNCIAVANPDQADEDSDGVGDLCDNCIYAKNPNQENNDGDNDGDACDPDDDNDGEADNLDTCAMIYDPQQSDRDGDGIGDCCDQCTFARGKCFKDFLEDTDGDGLPDECDNCPSHPNPDQRDSDGNGVADACERPGFANTAYNEDDKKGLTAQIMEKLLEIYYGN